MYVESADLYDLIYTHLKDYAAEARWLAGVIRGVAPDARTLLDVACGTGEHARWLSIDHGFAADGIDLDENLVRIARAKNPSGGFHCADMTDFALGKRYDIVSCLFGSIAYAKTVDSLRRVARCLSLHLENSGILLIEPFLTPEQLVPGRVTVRTFEDHERGIEICRMTHASALGKSATLCFEYLVGRKDGIEHRREIHELGLYTHDELTGALRDAGLLVETCPEGLDGRPLLLGRRRPACSDQPL